MSKVVTIREVFDWLTEQEVTAEEMEALIRYIEDQYPNERVIELQFKRLRFINFVGVIQCLNVRYEIMPKIALAHDDDRKALLQMLAAADFEPVRFFRQVPNGKDSQDLFTAFAAAFVEKLLLEFRKGTFKTYERQTGNLHVLRGKLELSRHVRENVFQKTRAYCSFDEQTEDNELNRLFKMALLMVKQQVKSPRLALQIEKCLGYLMRVDETRFLKQAARQMVFHRQNERFRDVFLFAQIIVEKASFYGKGQGSMSFSFLLPMNDLFEAYIEAALKKAAGPDKVLSQHAEKKLLRNKKTGYGSILLKPDFLVGSRLIIDTKWKRAQVNGIVRYEQSDVYQMYAYVTAYEQAGRCFLLYPKQEEVADYPVWEVTDTGKTIEMHTVRVDIFAETVRELKKLLENTEEK